MATANFSVVLPEGQAVAYAQVSLLQLARQLQLDYPDFRYQPLLVHDFRRGNKLYYNHYAFEQYVNGKLPLQKIIESCWCHGLYRNNAKLRAADGAEVEQGHLWLLRDEELILLDEDNYITGHLNTVPQLFDKII